MSLYEILLNYVTALIREDRKNILHLLYYSVIDAILVLSIPVATSMIINSVLAHASLSVTVLGFIVIVLFIFITFLQLIKEYIVEKFQQKVFLTTAIDIACKSLELKDITPESKSEHKRLMNYFFDITSIQKFFPILLLDGVGLLVKIIVSLLLLLAFQSALFGAGVLLFSGYVYALYWLGRKGPQTALSRSDAKHSAIHYLQHINEINEPKKEVLETFDMHLSVYAKMRQRLFDITIRQLGITFFMEGFIFSSFLMIGGYLVINGLLPLGEFVAAELVVASITYALKGFVKQLDYIYDTIEGVYKVNKLSVALEKKRDTITHI